MIIITTSYITTYYNKTNNRRQYVTGREDTTVADKRGYNKRTRIHKNVRYYL